MRHSLDDVRDEGSQVQASGVKDTDQQRAKRAPTWTKRKYVRHKMPDSLDDVRDEGNQVQASGVKDTDQQRAKRAPTWPKREVCASQNARLT